MCWIRTGASAALLLIAAVSFAADPPPPRVIHVFVALCDNDFQGIVPVGKLVGNGDDPANNLYWGAMYGLKNHFKKSSDWKLIETIKNPSEVIFERCVFKRVGKEVYLIADAYRGREIKKCVFDFLNAAPEAYTLMDAIEGWILEETPDQIHERAAKAYEKYQKCGIRGARKLFATGWGEEPKKRGLTRMADEDKETKK